MPSQADIRLHRAGVGLVSDVGVKELERVWKSLPLDDARETRRLIQVILPDLIATYGDGIASLSADWYDELRDEAKVSQPYRASPAARPEVDQITSLAGYSVGPLFGAEPDSDLALSKLSGGMLRLLANMDRETIAGNAALDPSPVRYARHASANACAFCALLATRGPVYVNEAAAGVVTGRSLGGTDYRKLALLGDTQDRRDAIQAGTRRRTIARGGRASRAGTKRPIGSKYHDSCRCTAVAVFGDQEYEEAPYVAKFRAAYANAPSVGATNPDAGDLSRTLAAMRAELGSK